MLGFLLHRMLDWIRIKKDPIVWARSQGVRVGENCRLIGVRPSTFGSEPYLIKIGNHVSMTGVQFVTHDGGVWIFRDLFPKVEKFGPIIVGDNVFIGMGAVIMPGVIIGDNCIIGAGSIVTRSIPPNSVAAGIPAKPIRNVDEYWSKVRHDCLEIRGTSLPEKRRILEEKYRDWFERETSK